MKQENLDQMSEKLQKATTISQIKEGELEKIKQ